MNKEIHKQRYERFIERCQNRDLPKDTYIERHHIIPRSLGGSNEEDNLIRLTAREHFIAHIILWKLYGGPMTHALWYLTITKVQGHYLKGISSRQYEALKIERSKYIRETFSGENHFFYGKKHTDETRQKMSASWDYDKHITVERNLKVSVGNKGKHIPSEVRKSISDTKTGEIPIHKDDQIKRIHEEDLTDYLIDGWELGTGVSPMKGKKHSQESKEKISKSVKKAGSIQAAIDHNREQGVWNKGKTLDRVENAEYLQKLSNSHKGLRHSDEAYEKMAQSRRGKKWMNKEGKGKLVSSEEISKYEFIGWSLGKPDKRSKTSNFYVFQTIKLECLM